MSLNVACGVSGVGVEWVLSFLGGKRQGRVRAADIVIFCQSIDDDVRCPMIQWPI